MTETRRPKLPADERRCKLNDGKGWRCSLPRSCSYTYCKKHHSYFQRKKADARARHQEMKKVKPDLEVNNNVGVQGEQLNLNRRRRRVKKMKPDLEVNNNVGVQDEQLNLNRRRSRARKTKTDLEEVKIEETKRPTKRKRVTRRPKQEEIGQTSNTFSRKKKKKRVSPKKKKKETIKGGRNADEGVVRVMELGQIWAFSDESDGGFPRSYARIDRIIPIPIPSRVEVTPLIPHQASEEERQFAEHGLNLACGTFKASGSTIVKDIQSFTHKAAFEEEAGRCWHKIFPRIGEIWAVHWESDVSRRGYRRFKLVEVVSDFSEEQGVSVFGLARVEGLSGVYQRQLHEGFYMIRCFSRKFMPMFSHQVPAIKIEEGGVEMRWKVMFH